MLVFFLVGGFVFFACLSLRFPRFPRCIFLKGVVEKRQSMKCNQGSNSINSTNERFIVIIFVINMVMIISGLTFRREAEEAG
jgi:hypothetical protein